MLSKLIRLGKDAELKTTPTGTQLLEITGVYDVGFGDNKTGQWIKLAMFGQRAEKLATHFTKGTQIVIYAEDIKARAWTNQQGEAQASLEGKLVEFQFAGGQQQGQQPQQQYAAPQQQMQQAPQMVPQQQAPQPQHQPTASNNPNQAAPQYAPPQQGFDQDVPS